MSYVTPDIPAELVAPTMDAAAMAPRSRSSLGANVTPDIPAELVVDTIDVPVLSARHRSSLADWSRETALEAAKIVGVGVLAAELDLRVLRGKHRDGQKRRGRRFDNRYSMVVALATIVTDLFVHPGGA